MKIAILLFACVALLDFLKVGATSNGYHTHSNGIQNPRPEVNAINIRPHTHPTGIQNPSPSNANAPRSRILIQRVVNGRHLAEHLLLGNLLPDPTIASHSGEYGYAIVDLSNGQRLYACLENRRTPEDAISVERIGAGFAQEFTAVVRISGGPRLEADITTGGERSSLVPNAGEQAQALGMHPVGHVRYINSNGINFNGALYQYS